MVSAISFWIRNPTYVANKVSESIVNLFRRSQPYLSTFANSFRRSILPLSPSLFALAVGVSGIAAVCIFRRYSFPKRPRGGDFPPAVSGTSVSPSLREEPSASGRFVITITPLPTSPAAPPVVSSLTLPESLPAPLPVASEILSVIERQQPSSSTTPVALRIIKRPEASLITRIHPEVLLRLATGRVRLNPAASLRFSPAIFQRLRSLASDLTKEVLHRQRQRHRLKGAEPVLDLTRTVPPRRVGRVEEIQDSTEVERGVTSLEWVLLEKGGLEPDLSTAPQKFTARVLFGQMYETAGRIAANITDKRPKITFHPTNEKQETFFTRYPVFFERYPFEPVVSVLCRLGGDITTPTLQEVTGAFGINVVWDHTTKSLRENWQHLPPLEAFQSLMVPVILQKSLRDRHFVDHIILLSVFPGAPGVIRYYDSQGIPLGDRLRNTFVRSHKSDPVSLRVVIERLQATYPGYPIEEKLTPRQPSYSVTCGLFVLREMLRRALPPPITERLSTINPKDEEAVRREIFSIYLDHVLHKRRSHRVVEVT